MNIYDLRKSLQTPPSTEPVASVAANRTGLGRNAFAGNPEFFQLPIDVQDLATRLTTEQLRGPNPYNAGFGRTADSLLGMGRSALGSNLTYSPSGYNAFQTSIEGLLQNVLRGQIPMEDSRKLGLMKTLLDLYGQAGSTLGAQMDLSAAQQGAYERRKSGEKQIQQNWLSQIPVVGGILSSFF